MRKAILLYLNDNDVLFLADWTSGTTNPDGTEIPEWLPIPYANMPTKGYIGLQGKHGESNIWFRNIQLKQL